MAAAIFVVVGLVIFFAVCYATSKGCGYIPDNP